jgi:hypothetical protein
VFVAMATAVPPPLEELVVSVRWMPPEPVIWTVGRQFDSACGTCSSTARKRARSERSCGFDS